MSKKIEQVRSITNVKHDGEYHLPGTAWGCPIDDVPRLVEAGSVERVPVSEQKEVVLLPVTEMKKKDVIEELTTRAIIFDKSEGLDVLRDVLTMARESQIIK